MVRGGRSQPLAGLEPDGIFGSGVVEIWQKLQPRMRAKAADAAKDCGKGWALFQDMARI